MRRLFLGVFIVVLAVTLTACGGSEASSDSSSETGSEEKDSETYTIRVAYLVPEGQSTHLAAEKMKEKLESESNGRLEVQLYPNGQLTPSDREAIEAIQLGNVEMTIPAVAALSGFNSKFMLFDLPYLFKDKETVYEVLDGEIGQSLLDELSDQGIKGLAFAENGFRHITNNKGPINTPADLEGLKLRTMESPVQVEAFKAMGANASPFAFGELYTALQQGTYDAMENPISLIYTNKFYEVQDYLTLSGHFYAPTALLINNDFYENLPEDLQLLVDEAAVEYRTYQREIASEQDAEWIEELKAEGMKVNELTDEQKEEFKKASEAVYDQFRDEIGGELIDQVLEITNK